MFSPEMVERLRHAWDEGKTSDPARPLDMKQLLIKALQRLKQSRLDK